MCNLIGITYLGEGEKMKLFSGVLSAILTRGHQVHMRRALSVISMILLLLRLVAPAPGNCEVNATRTVYIRSDGSIEGTDRIITSDNVTYILVANLTSGVVVERDNITINGLGYSLQGPGNDPISVGLDLYQRFNVTVENFGIYDFGFSINLRSSSDTEILQNVISTNYRYFGVVLHDSSGNNITANHLDMNCVGIQIDGMSAYNGITENNVTRSQFGIAMSSPDNTLSKNNVTNCDCGIRTYGSNRIEISSNNIADNRNESVHGAFGLQILNCNSSCIVANNIVDNEVAFEMHDSYDNLISGNMFARNGGPFHFDGSGHIILDNDFVNNTAYGLLFSGASDSVAVGNRFSENFDAALILRGSRNVIADNNITDTKKSIVDRAYAIDAFEVSESTIRGNTIIGNEDGVILHRFANSTFSNNCLKDNGETALYMLASNDSVFSQNHISGSSEYGVKIWYSSNNKFVENDFENNNVGISSQHSQGNEIFHNNFVNNSQGAETIYSVDYWTDTFPSGGNYWSDYNGTDANHDGIGDTPYIIDANNADNYPLMTQYIIPEFPMFLILPFYTIGAMLAVVAFRRKPA